MLTRTTNPNHKNYATYGGRGIAVDPTWHDFGAWWNYVRELPGCPYDSAGARVLAGISLDRINNNGHYEPGNVRWATAFEQRRNQRPRAHASSRSAALAA
jgi:hypothetical protein